MRRVILLAAALMLAMGGFFLYRQFSPTPALRATDGEVSNPFENAPPVDRSFEMGDVNIEEATRPQYTRLDPVTYKVREVYGFEALMNPRQESRYREVKRPYMIRYDGDSTMRVDADRGRMDMERIGSETVLRGAELMDNVVIRIIRGTGPEAEESVLEMDNLSYSSERSEFFTEGPIRMTSDTAELTGTGLTLLYDPRLQQLEYMKIRELDLLRLKDMAEPGKISIGGSSPDEGTELKPKPEVADASESRPVAASGEAGLKPAAVKPKETATATPASASAAASSRLYQCSVLENVEIRYGQELVIFGADEVNINRIFWEGSQAETTASEPKEKAIAANPSTAAEPRQVTPVAESTAAWPAGEGGEVAARDESRDILVTCDGGIVVQPMEATTPVTSTEPEIQMQGRQLRIDRLYKDVPQPVPMVSCQTLRYGWNDQILEMYPGEPQRPITLYLDEEGGEIETQGAVRWDRQSNKARIDGPGRIQFAGTDAASDRRGQLLFGGLMDLLFAERPAAEDSSSLALKTAQITGGMEAFMPEQGLRSRARKADFFFGPSNTPRRIDMEGDVEFETQADSDKSAATASRSTLLFDPQGLLESATLDGQVRMTSGKGLIRGRTANILFAEDAGGEAVVRKVEVTGEPVLENQTESGTPARFEAVRIDYDYQEGRAVAAGPVQFTFLAADPNRPELAPVPVTVTAEDRAEFIISGGDQIERVSFYGNVIGTSEVTAANERLVRRFYGQTMDVLLANDAGGKPSIGQVTVKDGGVKLQAIQYYEGRKVSHVEMDCQQFNYDGASDRITATGPGLIQLANPEVPAGSAIEGGFDLQQPCYAKAEDFDQLSWYLGEERLTAYGREGIVLSYLPVKDGVLGDKVIVQCVHAAAQMDSPVKGQSQLKELVATGGISYEDTGPKGVPLRGDRLTYRQADPWALIEGTDANPCYVGNTAVPFIRLNPVTGELETRLGTAPGPVPVPVQNKR